MRAGGNPRHLRDTEALLREQYTATYRARQEMERTQATTVIERVRAREGWPDEDYQEIMGCLGLLPGQRAERYQSDPRPIGDTLRSRRRNPTAPSPG